MLVDLESIKKIKSLGLNTYEVKIWTALLSRGVSTAGELSDIANVPRSRSYDVLESLEKKGFVVMKLGKPIKYLAVPPKEVLERVKGKIEENTKEHLVGINNPEFNGLVGALQETYEKSSENIRDTIAILKGRKNTQKHINFLIKESSENITLPKNMLGGAKEGIENTKTKVLALEEGLRICLVDQDNTILLPLEKKETHSDYDFGIWIKNTKVTKFFKQLLASN